MNLTPELLPDWIGVVDALYRFAAGQDRRDRDLFLSAFRDDATLDFTQPAGEFGVDVPVMPDRDAIARILTLLAGIDTTHTVTNPRVDLDGDRAALEALVEAQHVLHDEPSHRLLLKNRYDVELVRAGRRWQIIGMVITLVWFAGDPTVLFGPDARPRRGRITVP